MKILNLIVLFDWLILFDFDWLIDKKLNGWSLNDVPRLYRSGLNLRLLTFWVNWICFIFSSCVFSIQILNDLYLSSCFPYARDHDLYVFVIFICRLSVFCVFCTLRQMIESKIFFCIRALFLVVIFSCLGIFREWTHEVYCACWPQQWLCDSWFKDHWDPISPC